MNGGDRKVTEAQIQRELDRMLDDASHRRARIGVLVALALALLLGFLVARFAFVLVDVRGNGMSNAARSGDVALCVRGNAAQYLSRLGIGGGVDPAGISPGSVALVKYSDNGLLRQTLRRVVATGGSVVAVDEAGTVTVDGETLWEPYAVYRSGEESAGQSAASGGTWIDLFGTSETPAGEASSQDEWFLQESGDLAIDDAQYPLTVPEGMLFVLCDDRNNLLDSRSSRFGLVKETDVLGLAWVILWPLHRAGHVHTGALAG